MADDNIIESAEKAVSGDIAGVPVWVWIVGGVVVAGGVYLVFFRHSGGSGSALSLPSLASSPSGGSGSFGGDSSSNTPAASLTTNSDWLTSAIPAVLSALGNQINSADARLLLNEYLNGQAPAGNNNASSLFDKVVQAAQNAVGKPPQGVAPYSSSNPAFGSLADWLLASGGVGSFSSDILNQITALVNGTSTSLSQDAATALQQILDNIGAPPGGIPNYTTLAPGSPGPTAHHTDVATIGASLSTIWQTFGFEVGSNPTAYANDWIRETSALLGMPSQVATAAWNAIQSNPTKYVSQLPGAVDSQTALNNLVALINGLNDQYFSNPAAFVNLPVAPVNPLNTPAKK